MWAWLAPALSACLALGCQRSDSTRCSLGEAKLVTRDAVASYDGIAMLATRSGAYAVWSDKLGLFAKSLASNSNPATRVAEPCPGGIAAVEHDGFALACARPAQSDGDGSLWLFHLDAQLVLRSEQRLATLGRDARGVALAASASELFVAYADGQLGEPRVLLLALSQPDSAKALSTHAQNAREPALVLVDGVPIVAFTASEPGPNGPQHRLMISRAGKPAHALRDVQSMSPTPALAADREGLVVAFRDLPRPKARTELYVARVDPSLRLQGKARSIGRANGAGAPGLALCAKTRAVAVPIDHAGELYIAFHPLSARLEAGEANHQYYENEHEFVENSPACFRDHALTLIAERTQANQPEARLLAAEFRCKE